MDRENGAITNIWPIGGGKGGSGKTFLTGSLGILLAGKGKKTLLIDADLGAANLHTVIGIPHPQKTLSDFINKKAQTLEETVMETSTANLYFISGARDNLDMANMAHAQKAKLLRAIARLPYDYVLLDLGAGTSFNTLDFFTLSSTGIFVTTPEPTSIENVYRLIRSVYLRRIKQVLKEDAFRALVREAALRSNGSSVKNPEELLDLARASDPAKAEVLEASLRAFRFKLLLNQLRKQDNPQIGRLICRICEKHLGLEVQFLGNVHYDDRVHDAVCRKQHFVGAYPYTQTALDLREFCRNFSAAEEEISRPVLAFERPPEIAACGANG